MRVVVNECVDCGLPCLGSSCPKKNVVRYLCDECEEEEELYYFDGEELYYFDGEELCLNCIEERLEKVEG